MTMKYLMIVKANEDHDFGQAQQAALMAAISELSTKMTKAGVLVDQGGLLPSVAGTRITANGGGLSIADGPFAETKEVIGGYAIVKADSKAEAVELGRQFMQLHTDVLGPSYEGQLEIRQMFDAPAAGSR
jgi:hypothetical protein